MLTKISGKYVKFVVVLAAVGCVGFLAYLMITWKFGENTTVTRYTMPVKRESQSNTGLPRSSPRSQGAQTVRSKSSQMSETSWHPTTPDTRSAGGYLDTGDAESVSEREEVSSDASDVEDSSTTPQISAEALRRQTLTNRGLEIHTQIEAMAGKDGRVSPKDMLKALALFEESLRISQELGTLNSEADLDPFAMIKRSKFIASHTTEDGKIPVSIGLRMADMFENDGNHEAAEKMRILTKHALQNGDEFFEPRHAEALR